MADADTIHLYAAGSLKAALTDVAKAYETSNGNKVEAKFGSSGLLKNEIAGGAKANVFASANMAHPKALHDAGKSEPVTSVLNKMQLEALCRARWKLSPIWPEIPHFCPDKDCL